MRVTSAFTDRPSYPSIMFAERLASTVPLLEGERLNQGWLAMPRSETQEGVILITDCSGSHQKEPGQTGKAI